jgi:transcriptional regulator
MYIPKPFQISDWKQITDFVECHPAINLVTVGADGSPMATLLPAVWDTKDLSEGNYGVLITHISRGNEQWRSISNGQVGLAIVQGPQAYVSPSNYEKKLTDHKVVPTWNYQMVQLTGTLEVSEDRDLLYSIVSNLTDFHEQSRDRPWAASESDPEYMQAQLGGIVAITMRVTKVEAKFKLSQNRSEADQAAIAADLALSSHSEEREISDQMRTLNFRLNS